VSRLTQLSEELLRQPLVWGGLASMAFYALVVGEAEQGSPLDLLFAGDLWQFKAATCVIAFTALASLGMRLLGIGVQLGALERDALAAPPAGGNSAADARELLAELDESPRSFDSTFLGARLRRALNLVRQRGSADSLETDLRTLADDDRRGVADRFAGVRLAAVSVLLIGAAGAATGIAAPLAGVTDNTFDAALPGILQQVGLAAAGVAQAVALAIAVLFAKLGVERTERRLLRAVDVAAERQLMGRFTSYGTEKDPHLASIQRMSEKLLESVESAAQRQEAELAKSLASANHRWEDMAASASSLLHRTLGEAVAAGVSKLATDLQGTLVRHAEILSENIDRHTAGLADALEHHASVMTAAEKSLAAENQRHLDDMQAGLGEAMLLNATRQEKLIAQSEDLLKEMQVALVEAAGTTVAQQEQLIKQSDVLLKVVDATGQVRRLEEALNSNLLSLAASHNFEQTATSLAAAVQLLSVRLRQPAIVRNEIDLGGDETTSQAA
jgi:hypothetical protein